MQTGKTRRRDIAPAGNSSAKSITPHAIGLLELLRRLFEPERPRSRQSCDGTWWLGAFVRKAAAIQGRPLRRRRRDAQARAPSAAQENCPPTRTKERYR